jgi:hypothetical protein
MYAWLGSNLSRLGNGLRQFWELVLIATRYAMLARFCVIAGLAVSVALLTVEQGREMLRALSEPRAITFAYDLGGAPGLPKWSDMPWDQLGWFSFGIIVLSLACWASARLCYGLVRETAIGEDRFLEKLMERKLPMYYGALPLVVAGCGFWQEAFLYLPLEIRPAGAAFVAWAAPLGLLFGVPVLVIFRWLILGGAKSVIARSGPGLRYFLCVCNLLPIAAGLYLWRQETHLVAGLGMIAPALLASQYFFMLALGIYWCEWPWVVILPGIVLMLTVAFRKVDPPAMWSVIVAAVAHIALGVAFRRIAIGRMETRLLLSRRLKIADVMGMVFFFPPPAKPKVGRTEIVTLRAAGVVSIILIGVTITVWLSSKWLPRFIGPAAVLSLALTAWVVVGNGLIVGTRAARLPLIFFALLLALVGSICEDNHGIRLLPLSNEEKMRNGDEKRMSSVSKHYPDVAALFRDWDERMAAKYPLRDGQIRPCFIIATEGGGIRAAFWTAQVLARLEDESLKMSKKEGTPDFASHVLAISGVSGGSLGASIFDALYTEAEDSAIGKGPVETSDLGSKAAFILGSDHLSPLVGTMLFPDAIQRFVPWTLPGTDRGTALERSWEDRWQYYVGGRRNRFAEAFLQLWHDRNDAKQPWLPALFLNATRVEDGRRIIASNVKINSGPEGEFPDALDLHDYLWSKSTVVHGPWERFAQLWRNKKADREAIDSKRCDIRLSTATHCSARFTYFSPAARLPSGHRVVDGGYYEDSGGETAREVLSVVNGIVHNRGTKEPIQPIIILIRYIEMDDPSYSKFASLAPAASAATVGEYALSDAVSPLLALMQVRGAHATDEYASFGRLYEESATRGLRKVYPFQLAQRQIPLPLGWMLCGRSAGEMVNEMPQVDSPPPVPASVTISENLTNLNGVLDWLRCAETGHVTAP